MIDHIARVHPSSDGTSDAPMDDQSSRVFWVVAAVVTIVGIVLVASAVLAR